MCLLLRGLVEYTIVHYVSAFRTCEYTANLIDHPYMCVMALLRDQYS